MNGLKRLVVPLLLLASLSAGAYGQTLTTLWQFGAVPANGLYPGAGLVLIQAADSNFYGTTFEGGTNGAGTVFRLTPAGSLSTLWQFGGATTNGANPYAGLVQAGDGFFYGTTVSGGMNGSGTVYRITAAGTLTTLYQFGGLATDGSKPESALVQAGDGALYGATAAGGTNGAGTVYRITTAGTLTTLHQFGALPADGSGPAAGLTQAGDGALYGTTASGGTNAAGTVFRITTAGTLTTLYQFGGLPTDGSGPVAGLALGCDGFFYGTTAAGGTNAAGTVFRITSAGTLTTLCQFSANPTNDQQPHAGLVQGSDGNFYGTTFLGGTNQLGAVFRISPAGVLSTLWQFGGNNTNGDHPEAGLVQGTDGNFYGATPYGGTNSVGAVYRLSVPLTPPPWPINQITGFKFAGANVLVTIPTIAAETYQLQFTHSLTPTNWTGQGAPVTALGSLMTFTNPAAASPAQGFYRYQITP